MSFNKPELDNLTFLQGFVMFISRLPWIFKPPQNKVISIFISSKSEKHENNHFLTLKRVKEWWYFKISLFTLVNDPQLEGQICQFLCEKVMIYTIFMSFSSWIQPCNFWNDRKAEIRGQPVLRHLGPSPSACFGSNEGVESSLVTTKTGGRAWPKVL